MTVAELTPDAGTQSSVLLPLYYLSNGINKQEELVKAIALLLPSTICHAQPSSSVLRVGLFLPLPPALTKRLSSVSTERKASSTSAFVFSREVSFFCAFTKSSLDRIGLVTSAFRRAILSSIALPTSSGGGQYFMRKLSLLHRVRTNITG